MKAISINGPWWWYIMQGVKPVENRSWASGYRGPLLIQVSQNIRESERIDAMEMARQAGWKGGVPSPADLQDARGMIVGHVTMTDCVMSHPSPFFSGRFGHVYANPVLFRSPVKCRGYQQLFDVSDDLVRDALREAGLVAAGSGSGDLFGGLL